MCRLMICGKRYVVCGKWYAVLFLIIFSSCNYTKNLSVNDYALIKNTVKVEDIKGQEFDNLIDLVRPIPNRKFMEIFPIKVSLWAYHQPKFDSITGKTKDSKFNQWLRNRGEPTMLLDSGSIRRSLTQIELAMFQCGYFDAKARADVQYLKKQKAKVNYSVTPNLPYSIRSIDYDIEIPEYKRIIITDTANSLIKKGMIYNEDIFVAERARMVSKVRDQGYYYMNTNLITFWIDTLNAFEHPNAKGNPTLALTIKISFDEATAPTLIAKSKNRYKFNNALIYTNYDLNFDKSIHLDTIFYMDFRNKQDSTLYKFVTIKKLKKKSNKLKLVKDYHSRTIAGAMYMKKGDMYSQMAYDRTAKKLRALNNFTIINISYKEDETLWDSIHKTGVLNTTLQLTRAKQSTVGGEFQLRTDRTALELSYTNKNIFRGAEYLKIKTYGNVYYYEWFNSLIKETASDYSIYGEVGGVVSLTFPRLLMLPKYQKINLLSYATDIIFSTSYITQYSRLNMQASYIYSWSRTRYLQHSISPVELATLDSRSSRDTTVLMEYPASYQRKFQKFFLPSAKYTLRYEMPQKNLRHKLSINFSFETVGVLLYTTNKIINNAKIWKVFNDFNYGTYEKFDFSLIHTRNINKNNAFSSRFVFGMAVPYQKGAVIPFERSFFVGGASSMRGWGFRQLGPGGYDHSNHKYYLERVGDMKLELNLEYRGTIYKAIKFGIFSDMGNVWLLSKYDEMPNAEFNIHTFYKQIAACVGAGIRLDFNYIIIRLDYGMPIYNPTNPAKNNWINKNWFTQNNKNKWWSGKQGIQFGIGYAFY